MKHIRSGAPALTAWVLLTSACDMSVTNPGNIDDAALTTPQAVSPLVAGMAADFATGFDNLAYFMGIASGEITHTGAFIPEQEMERGDLNDLNTDAHWNNFHRARWVAEQGLERMQGILGENFNKDPRTIEAYIWAGFSNRVLGEFMCNAVFDGGPAEPYTKHFERAEQWFGKALELATAQQQGATGATLATAQEWARVANAGLAQIRLLRENWNGAAAAAALVPDNFVFRALYSTAEAREQNWLNNESWVRAYYSTHNTFADTYYTQTGDARMRWTNMNRVGVDGRTPYKRQEKYPTLGTAIVIARGAEMRLIEAEVRLRAGDVPGAMAKINAVRQAANVAQVTATTTEQAWQKLWEERQIVMWLEARHLPDRRRLKDAWLNGRGSCIPISAREKDTNPNIDG
jgi:starch-binding outer membrane protein, SusD/RagB family